MTITHDVDLELRRSAPRLVAGLATAVAVGLAIGMLTAYGQEWLSDSTGSLANSAGPWSVAAFLVARYNRRLFPAVAAAMITLACCELGYVIATEIRDGSNSTATVVFWLTAAALAGPPLGVAGSWSTQHGVRRAAGFAVLGGVLIGEAVYGWTTVADTTDWRYWAAELFVGLGIVGYATLAPRRAHDALAAIGLGGLTALVVFAVARLA